MAGCIRVRGCTRDNRSSNQLLFLYQRCQWQGLLECVAAQKTTGVRISFFSCIKDALYLKAITDSYHTYYRPRWVYNTETIPTDLLLERRQYCLNVYVDEEIANPDISQAHEQWLRPHGVKWRSKIANHISRFYWVYQRKIRLKNYSPPTLPSTTYALCIIVRANAIKRARLKREHCSI